MLEATTINAIAATSGRSLVIFNSIFGSREMAPGAIDLLSDIDQQAAWLIALHPIRGKLRSKKAPLMARPVHFTSSR
jgi:hypothetical protein